MINVPIFVDKLYKYDLFEEPCAIAIPFAMSKLNTVDVSRLIVVDEQNRTIPCSFKITATWPDGSVKYLFVRMLPNLEANKNIVFTLTDRSSLTEVLNGITVIENVGEIAVDTGAMSFVVADSLSSVFKKVKFAGVEYQAEQFVGPILRFNGSVQNLKIENWRILEKSAVCCILEGSGKYSDNYRVDVRITAFKGKDYLDISFRLFNDTNETFVPDSWIFYVKRDSSTDVDDSIAMIFSGNNDSTGCGDMNEATSDEGVLYYSTTGTGSLAEIEKEIALTSSEDVRTLTGISNYKTRFEISGMGKALSNIITAESLIGEANEHFAEVLYGTFMGDVTDNRAGVCATIYQAHQNFPKALKSSKEGLCIYLIPEGKEKVRFSRGMAREQKILLHFHGTDMSIEELDNRSLIYQMPISPWVSPEQFANSEVFPNIVTPNDRHIDTVELSLIDKADNHGRAYGMMNWGDFPDANYTAQGRGGGRLVWSNNEYDFPHAMFMMYARTGIRRFLDYGRTSALHWMDVDVCHFSDNNLNYGGQWEHTCGHNGGEFQLTGVKGVMVCSHEWVEGLLDLWHFTGDERAFSTAIGIGENILRLLETPMYQKPGEANARETGWALRSLIALYLETGDDKWIAKSNWIIDQFKQWKDKYGAWLAPYTDNTVIRVGFMISVAVGSLMRYYRVFPNADVKEMIIAAVDDLIENAMNGYGVFYYKELPSLSRNGSNTLLLESMYIGYELTSDVKYLKAGLKTFWNNISSNSSYDGGKKMVEDAVLIGKTSPKAFAQSFLPLVQFYNAALSEGLI